MSSFSPSAHTQEIEAMGNKLRTKYLQWLLPYISEDDGDLDRETFLRYLADRIHDDLSHKPNPPEQDT